MVEKIFFCLIILRGLLWQEVPGVFSKNIDDSNPLVRKKRVINSLPGGDEPTMVEGPFIVYIQDDSRNLSICVGSILSKHTVITAASCTRQRRSSNLKIISATKYLARGGEFHDVIGVTRRTGGHANRNGDGVALLTVRQGFIFNTRTAPIRLHEGPLLPGMHAVVFGWGCNPSGRRGTDHRHTLRSIIVPIMSHWDCVHAYQGHTVITDNDVCTFSENQRCGHTDAGAPLVVENHLAGLHLWRDPVPDRIEADVFVVLPSLEYSAWIRNNTVHNLH